MSYAPILRLIYLIQVWLTVLFYSGGVTMAEGPLSYFILLTYNIRLLLQCYTDV